MRTSWWCWWEWSGPGEGIADREREVVLLAVVGDERLAVPDDYLGSHVVGEREIRIDGEADRQIGVKALELAEQVTNGQVVRHGVLPRQGLVAPSAGGASDERGEESRNSLGGRVEAELLGPRVAFGGLHLDSPDDAALPGGGVFREPADVDAAVRTGHVDVGFGGVDDCPAQGVEEAEDLVRAVVGGEPVAVLHGRADGSGKEGSGGVHEYAIPSMTCGFSNTRTLTCGLPKDVVVSRGTASAVGELVDGGSENVFPGMDRWTRLSYGGCGDEPHGTEGGTGMTESRRHWDGAALERKIRAAGRPWTVGDIVMVADGQWAVGVQSDRRRDEDAVVENRIADGRHVELTWEELARAVGSRLRDAHRDEDGA